MHDGILAPQFVVFTVDLITGKMLDLRSTNSYTPPVRMDMNDATALGRMKKFRTTDKLSKYKLKSQHVVGANRDKKVYTFELVRFRDTNP